MQNLNINQFLNPKNNHNPLLFNFGLWSFIFVILLFVFTKGSLPIKVDFAFTGAFVLLLIFPVLLNFYTLIPKLLKKERYLIYLMLFLLSWYICSFLIDIGLSLVLDTLFPGLFFISYPRGLSLYVIIGVILVASTLLKLAEDWFYFNTSENRQLRYKNTQVETQLSALKAQINPHFLFNALNVIYALALEKNEKISNSIVQLSDILRYVLYDTNVERVSIDKEIELLENYIQFEKARQQQSYQVNFNAKISNPNFEIYPMLLLPLVENAFKHGNLNSDPKHSFIKIDLTENNNHFTFNITNSFEEHKQPSISEVSGIGLENIKANLELVYPNSHRFSFQKTQNQFNVNFSIS